MKDDTKKRKTRRSKIKHPNLDRKYNIKARRDYIETDYIDGIYDSNGNEVMRPLTDEEKEWLDQFYKETVNANLSDAKLYKDKKDRKQIYSENNARNRCLYNQAKKTGKLSNILDILHYEKLLMGSLYEHDLEHVIINDKDLDDIKKDS